MIIEESPLKKGRFIIQEVHEVHEKRIFKNPRHESISQMKKVFMTTHYKSHKINHNNETFIKNNSNSSSCNIKQPSLLNEYSSLVYDHSIGQWINFDLIWEHHNISKNASEASFGKIFHYLFDDTGEDSSHLISNEDHSTIATHEKGIFKESSIKKPKSYSCLYQNNNNCTSLNPYPKGNERLSCVSNESIQYKGMINAEKKNKRNGLKMEIIREHNFTLLNKKKEL